jgi:hypothetical protein
MIEVLLSMLLSMGAVSSEEAKSLKNDEKAVLEIAEEYKIAPSGSETKIIDAEDIGM